MGNLEAKNITITSREEAIQAHEALRKYIFDCIENGKFEIKSMDNYRVNILIDGYLRQSVWIANGRVGVSFKSSVDHNDVNFLPLKVKEKDLLWERFALANKEDLKANKLELIERLQAEIDELENN